MDNVKFFTETTHLVRQIIKNISLSDSKEIPLDDEDLFSSGQLDSVVLVGLLTELEEKFKLNISQTEFTPENFSTIRGIVKLVERIKNDSKDS